MRETERLVGPALFMHASAKVEGKPSPLLKEGHRDLERLAHKLLQKGFRTWSTTCVFEVLCPGPPFL